MVVRIQLYFHLREVDSGSNIQFAYSNYELCYFSSPKYYKFTRTFTRTCMWIVIVLYVCITSILQCFFYIFSPTRQLTKLTIAMGTAWAQMSLLTFKVVKQILNLQVHVINSNRLYTVCFVSYLDVEYELQLRSCVEESVVEALGIDSAVCIDSFEDDDEFTAYIGLQFSSDQVEVVNWLSTLARNGPHFVACMIIYMYIKYSRIFSPSNWFLWVKI